MTIKKSKITKAVGQDIIPVSTITKFALLIELILRKRVDNIPYPGHYPKFCIGITSMDIPKKNKNSSKQLPSHLTAQSAYEITETVVEISLRYELDTVNLIPSARFGYKQGSGTDDAYSTSLNLYKMLGSKRR